MSRNATFEEVQQPPAVRQISNVANRAHPYVQSLNTSTAYVVRTAANTATIRLALFDGFGNAVQDMVHMSFGAAVTSVTLTACTSMSITEPGATPYNADILSGATGLISVAVLFAAGGDKPIVVTYGNYRITLPAFPVT